MLRPSESWIRSRSAIAAWVMHSGFRLVRRRRAVCSPSRSAACWESKYVCGRRVAVGRIHSSAPSSTGWIIADVNRWRHSSAPTTTTCSLRFRRPFQRAEKIRSLRLQYSFIFDVLSFNTRARGHYDCDILFNTAPKRNARDPNINEKCSEHITNIIFKCGMSDKRETNDTQPNIHLKNLNICLNIHKITR